MEFIKQTSSTIQILTERVKNKNIHDFDCLYSFSQTSGIGRNNREFVSNYGGVYYSVCINTKHIKTQSLAPLIAALATVKAIKDVFNLNCKIKWVNDVLYNGKKCAGILVKVVKDFLVIGIGTNIYNKIPTELNYKAISLLQNINIDENILHQFAKVLDSDLKAMFKEIPKETEIINDYKQNCVILGKKCNITDLNGNLIFSGVASDILNDGNIVIKSSSETKTFNTGEVSLVSDLLYR